MPDRRPAGRRRTATPAARPVGPPSAGRVIAGAARGTKLVAPGEGTRPIGDRVKEALFAILEPDLRKGAFLDLFAGSGAAGIEALSRGAPAATFVERDPGAAAVVRANLERSHLGGSAVHVVRADALGWLATSPAFGNGPFRVVVVDPPYDREDLLLTVLDRLGETGGVLAPAAVVVAKHSSRTEPPARIGLLASDRARRFGETTLTFYRADQPTEAEA